MILALSQIVQLLTTYKYVIILPIAIVEGPIVTIIAGFLASQGILSLPYAYITLVIGDLIGDILYYVAGRLGRKKLIDKWGHYIGLTSERIKTAEKHFHQRPGWTFMIGKFTQVFGGAVLVAAGVSRFPFLKYFWYNVIGTVIKSFVVLMIGYYFGRAYTTIANYSSKVTWIMLVLGCAIIVLYVICKKRLTKKLNIDEKI